MAVDDLWFSSRRGPDGERVPTSRNGRGRRWRVRWSDPETGAPTTKLFAKKSDAERHDAAVRTDVARGVYVDPAGGRTTVTEWLERHREQQLHRDSTAQLLERYARLHVAPILGRLRLAEVRTSHLRTWVKDRAEVLAPATLATIYNGLLVPAFRAAVADRLIATSPCVGVRLPAIEHSEHVIATPDQVHALYDELPARYRTLVYVAAGCGLRAGEAFGLELAAVDFLRREAVVRQQVKTVGGRAPYLAPPKTPSSRRTVELPAVVTDALARHLETTGPRTVEIDDETDERHPTRRRAELIFTNGADRAIQRATFSQVWAPAVRRVGLPSGFGMRDLRHYFATVLIFGGANIKTVQLAMGHTTPTITLNTYVGLWPDAVDRTRSLVDSALSCTQVVPEVSVPP